MHRFKHIFFWVAVVISTAPFFLPNILQVQRAFIKHEMMERMEHEALHTLVIDSASVQWEKKGKEIWVDNMLFDIKQLHYENGKMIVKGLFDHKEKAIVAKFNGIQSSLPFEKERNQSIFQLLHLETILTTTFFIGVDDHQTMYHAFLNVNPIHPVISLPNPPPEQFTI